MGGYFTKKKSTINEKEVALNNPQCKTDLARYSNMVAAETFLKRVTNLTQTSFRTAEYA